MLPPVALYGLRVKLPVRQLVLHPRRRDHTGANNALQSRKRTIADRFHRIVHAAMSAVPAHSAEKGRTSALPAKQINAPAIQIQLPIRVLRFEDSIWQRTAIAINNPQSTCDMKPKQFKEKNADRPRIHALDTPVSAPNSSLPILKVTSSRAIPRSRLRAHSE